MNTTAKVLIVTLVVGFVGFLTALPNYDPTTPLQAFLFSICAHKLTDRLRQTGRRPLLLPVAEDEGHEPASPANHARRASTATGRTTGTGRSRAAPRRRRPWSSA